MLTVTKDAIAALRAALNDAELAHPSGSGIRIAARSVRVSGTSGRPRLELFAVSQREPGDEIVHVAGGPSLFIAPLVVPLVKGKVLDGEVDAHGHPHFKVTDRQPAHPVPVTI
jgi:hypothetical protein